MSDVRDAAKSGDLTNAITNLGTSLTRVSVAAMTLPTYLLPERSRAEATGAATNFVNAVGAFHLSFAKTVVTSASAVVRGLSNVANSVQQTSKTVAPAAAPVAKR